MHISKPVIIATFVIVLLLGLFIGKTTEKLSPLQVTRVSNKPIEIKTLTGLVVSTGDHTFELQAAAPQSTSQKDYNLMKYIITATPKTTFSSKISDGPITFADITTHMYVMVESGAAITSNAFEAKSIRILKVSKTKNKK